MRPLVLATLLLGAAPLTAQLSPPPTWRWVTDRPAKQSSTPDTINDSTFTFVQMPPGWHMTMGPGGVLFDPRYFAGDSYTLESQIYHFPSSANEGYGLMVGGADLEGQARYVVFAMRGDGSVAAWEHAAGRDRMLAPWARADAVHPGVAGDVIGNVLRLTVTPTEAVLKANGLDVLILPREGLELDGQFGFRVGPDVNLHATTLTLTSRLAPVPPPRP